jgi:ABC-type transporter Mla MlaB component
VAQRAESAALAALADQVPTAKQTHPAADVSAPERQTDQRVYRLYGLTPEEIRIVEETA